VKNYKSGNKMNLPNTIKWIATFVTLSGAIATAAMIDPLNIYLFNLGAILFLIWGYLIRDKAMVTVNSGLLVVYCVGLFVRM